MEYIKKNPFLQIVKAMEFEPTSYNLPNSSNIYLKNLRIKMLLNYIKEVQITKFKQMVKKV